ncbi:hypothetical protein ACQ3G6_17400 [Allorhizobium undicola]|uniref:hypothetical protein n=1 Tax=Allorhizobium undicola TaxID=78527 RepID=UPI003D3414EE
MSAQIIPFRRPAQTRAPGLDETTLDLLNEAENCLMTVIEEVDIECENIRHGANLSEGGGLRNGRAAIRAAELTLSLINLTSHPERFSDLSRAARLVVQSMRT